ncbi:exopolyphosphatase / guanosine-5'-triphosphate,3'-diphosphate pyrophosphatase [Arachidicoccus rhizosphaerae]|uniref:Exopolyphosphatase / guanosine-5'-triphosphate,3'-diphosphate pyrophosphatase n=1 Tax=Arachidicoccus rhizosphaerae TaxID=551991 RepID=A0A1H3YJA4_9BACT|nr:exopolyphosphatase [Arachidicoccus rhizosphaerae]SEA11615.1 exopolyphosphatase / guanosine-5'-triphosphate,3'-diphosphate pyrophosphatase [Arachidicoccus rhizosphaerae]
MVLAAIDIGSNASRLLIADVKGKGKNVEFSKMNLVRVPLRLGMDVFKLSKIGPKREAMLINTMQAYRHLMNAYGVEQFRACATSAMRDAQNSKTIIADVKKKTGIPIEIITGAQEASLVFKNHIAEMLSKEHAYLYIDVGGGSTELNFYVKGKQIFKKSINIGTIRLLEGQWSENDWNQLKKLVEEKIVCDLPITAIGSGGNINKIFSLSKTKEGKPLSIRTLRNYYKQFEALTVPQRMHQYNLREDRADVIVPALQIYLQIMRWTGAQEIYVPKIGVADGLIRELYTHVKK